MEKIFLVYFIYLEAGLEIYGNDYTFFNIQRINFKFETVLDFNIDIFFWKREN